MPPAPFVLPLILAAALGLSGCDRGQLRRDREPAPRPVIRQDRALMHSRVTIAIADPLPEASGEQVFDEAFAVFERIDETMNEWRPESALGRVNAQAGGEPIAAPGPLCEVVAAALEGARRTHGLFDPTWAALGEVWRFPESGEAKAPSAEAVAAACQLVDWREVELRPLGDAGAGACSIRLPRAGMKLGLGGVVKGWGVDQAVALLRARGLKNFFVQAGGDLYLAGRNGDRPWRVGIRDPRGPPERSFAWLEVEDRAFSTSGDYEHFFIENAKRYHHLIDPRGCYPATASRSVSILAKSALDAELLTKAVFIAGPEEGLALAESWGSAAVIVASDNRVLVSPALAGKLEAGVPTP